MTTQSRVHLEMYVAPYRVPEMFLEIARNPSDIGAITQSRNSVLIDLITRVENYVLHGVANSLLNNGYAKLRSSEELSQLCKNQGDHALITENRGAYTDNLCRLKIDLDKPCPDITQYGDKAAAVIEEIERRSINFDRAMLPIAQRNTLRYSAPYAGDFSGKVGSIYFYTIPEFRNQISWHRKQQRGMDFFVSIESGSLRGCYNIAPSPHLMYADCPDSIKYNPEDEQSSLITKSKARRAISAIKVAVDVLPGNVERVQKLMCSIERDYAFQLYTPENGVLKQKL